MSTKIEKLILLKKDIDNIQEKINYELNFEENDVKINVNDVDEWTKSENIFSDGEMKSIPILNSKDINYNILCFIGPSDSFVNNHKHPYDKLLICTKGLVRFVKNNNEHIILKPLNSIFVKKNTLHYIEFIDESEILVLWGND